MDESGGSPRRRKVARASPVDTQRTGSPARVNTHRKPKQRVFYDDSSSEEEGQSAKRNRPMSYPSPHSQRKKSSEFDKQSRAESLNNLSNGNFRRHTQADPLTKVVNPTSGCFCEKRNTRGCNLCRRRHTAEIKPTELMEQEAKLLVLEYLSSLDPQKLTARNSGRSGRSSKVPRKKVELSASSVKIATDRSSLSEEAASSSCDSGIPKNIAHVLHQLGDDMDSLKDFEETHSFGASYKEMRKSTEEYKNKPKSQTVTIGEYERKALMDMIAADQAEKAKGDRTLQRSHSDITEERIANMRKKLEKLKKPVVENIKTISSNMKSEIEEFDKILLKSEKRRRIESPKKKSKAKPPKLVIPRVSELVDESEETISMSPQTFAVNKLEDLSEEITKNFPDIFSQSALDLFIPFKTNNFFSYEMFIGIVKKLTSQKVSPDKDPQEVAWTSTALVLNTVKESMLTFDMDDKQMELLIDYSTKYVTDNANALKAEESSLINDFSFHSGSSGDEHSTPSEGGSRRGSSHQLSVTETLTEWAPFGMAVLGVGLGIVYSYSKN